MIYTIEKLKEIEAFIKLANIDPNDITTCINILKGSSISEILNKKYLNLSDVELIKDCIKNEPVLYDNDIVTLISKMNVYARERSHGATLLSKVFMSSTNYNKLIGEIGGETLTVGRVPIVKNDDLVKPNNVIGICYAKYNHIPSDMLLVSGSTVKMNE